MISPELVRAAHRLEADGETVRSAAPLLGVSPATVQRALQIRPTCKGCGAKLRSLTPDVRCGFCREEDKPEGQRL